MNLTQIRYKLEQAKGRKAEVEKKLTSAKTDLKEFKKQKAYADKAKIIIREVALETQQRIEQSLSELVSMALADIFPDPYRLKVSFEEKRGKTECQLYFEKEGNLYDPMDSVGGGPVDVASFVLRVCAWALQKPQARPVIIADEPFRFMAADLRDAVGQMLKGLSKNIQFIIITHDEVISRYADRTFIVTQTDRKSKITVVGEESEKCQECLKNQDQQRAACFPPPVRRRRRRSTN